MINKAQVLGRVGRIETKHLSSGTQVSNVSMVTTEKFQKNGEKQEKSTWHSIVLFGKMSEIADKYVTQGDLFYVEGQMDSQKYTGQDGQERTKFVIIGREIKLIPKGSPRSQDKQEPIIDDDLPF